MTYRNNTERARPEPELAVQQLKSLVAELVTTLNDLLNDERDRAAESLSRAAALLQGGKPSGLPQAPGSKGMLAPWQVRRITAHVESNLAGALRSSALAALVGLSPAHFSRTFRNTFGCSPLEYVTRRRMERAQGLMLATDVPLAQIALDCGLADQAHFSRLFRKVVGECPRAWRRARASAVEPSETRRDENVLALRRLAMRSPLQLLAERRVQEVVDR